MPSFHSSKKIKERQDPVHPKSRNNSKKSKMQKRLFLFWTYAVRDLFFFILLLLSWNPPESRRAFEMHLLFTTYVEQWSNFLTFKTQTLSASSNGYFITILVACIFSFFFSFFWIPQTPHQTYIWKKRGPWKTTFWGLGSLIFFARISSPKLLSLETFRRMTFSPKKAKEGAHINLL